MKTRGLLLITLVCLYGCGRPGESAHHHERGQSEAAVEEWSGSQPNSVAITQRHEEGILPESQIASHRAQPTSSAWQPALSPRGHQEATANQRGRTAWSGRRARLVILAATDVAPTSEITILDPTSPRQFERRLCTVAIRPTADLGHEQALLYSYFTPDTPEPLRKLNPDLLTGNFGSSRLGTFSGGRGAVSGMQRFTGTVPEELVLLLPRGSAVQGTVGVRAQLWLFSDGKWHPDNDVLEQTITLK